MIKQSAIICDIDNTLANTKHRAHFLKQQWEPCECVKECWRASYLSSDNNKYCQHCDTILKTKKNDMKSFHEAMHLDTPNEWCVDILYRMSAENRIIFITGREEKYKDITKHQIAEWCNIIGGHQLFMRSNKDYRSDIDIKAEIYTREIFGKYGILFVLEDRSRVVNMWRNMGLVCLQCAKGDY